MVKFMKLTRAKITDDEGIIYIGKQVTVCTKVCPVKVILKVSFIDVGVRYQNSPLTLVIFAKDI